ncbi:MAG TPA: ABC transporter permease [Terriglobales bacterium]|nr:ABC transporter permease [Terriglobales bacterium]
MFVRLVYESFRRQTRRKLLVAAAVTLGAAVSTAMIAIATDIGDKINRELQSYGANLVVTPEDDTLDVQIGSVNLKPAGGAYLNEGDLPKIKGIFWRNNITAFTPELSTNVRFENRDLTLLGTYFSKPLKFGNEEFKTGARNTFPWWRVEGAWPDDNSEDLLVGKRLASRRGIHAGQELELNGKQYRVSGILSTGGAEDDEMVAPLSLVQGLLGRSGAVGKIFVSARTKPEDAFARRNPDQMTAADRDRWYCSAYPESIAYQIQQVIAHSHAEQIRQVQQNQGNILSRIEGLMLLITLAALFTSGLAVSAAMATAMFERRQEIGVMKALGAGQVVLSAIFISEAVLLGCVGGVAGFFVGSLLAHRLGVTVFGSAIAVAPVVLPLALGIAVAVSFLGSAAAIRRGVKYDPVHALRGVA